MDIILVLTHNFCADNLDGVVKYMCLPQGGCYYARDALDDRPYDEYVKIQRNIVPDQ
jgi:hypothetical protein